MSNLRTTVTAEGAPRAVGPYSHATIHNGVVYCSGQLPIDPSTGAIVDGSVRDCTVQSLANLEKVCAAAGANLREDALHVRIFLIDMSSFPEVNEAYAEFFGDSRPARTTVGVSALPLGAPVEFEAMVALAQEP